MKITRAFVLSLLVPVGLAAQQQPAAKSGNVITDVFRGRTMSLQHNLAQAFDSIPGDKFDYKPTPAQLTIGHIAEHLANDNYFFCDQFGAMKGKRTAEETSTPDSVKATWPKEKLVTQLKASFDFCEKAFAQLGDAKLTDDVTMSYGGNSRQVPRVAMVLIHVQDMTDHYSQIANYMRLNGLLPPTALPRGNAH
ncbi:MAG TPA: DinB family protein [Gemmatimonadaceae bacterium]|nr:DinB family protein [Gemmatimonadaceae bacterium]